MQVRVLSESGTTSPVSCGGVRTAQGCLGSPRTGVRIRNICAVACAMKVPFHNELFEQSQTRGAVQLPEPARLHERQAKSRHLLVFGSNSSHELIVDRHDGRATSYNADSSRLHENSHASQP